MAGFIGFLPLLASRHWGQAGCGWSEKAYGLTAKPTQKSIARAIFIVGRCIARRSWTCY